MRWSCSVRWDHSENTRKAVKRRLGHSSCCLSPGPKLMPRPKAQAWEPGPLGPELPSELGQSLGPLGGEARAAGRDRLSHRSQYFCCLATTCSRPGRPGSFQGARRERNDKLVEGKTLRRGWHCAEDASICPVCSCSSQAAFSLSCGHHRKLSQEGWCVSNNGFRTPARTASRQLSAAVGFRCPDGEPTR